MARRGGPHRGPPPEPHYSRSWQEAHPAEATAAANLRIAGVSERHVFEKFQLLLRDPPSYRDLRGAYQERGVLTRRGAHSVERLGLRFVQGKAAAQEKGRSEYRDRLEAQFSDKQRDKLNRDMAVGYLFHELETGGGLPPTREAAIETLGAIFTDEVNVDYFASDYEKEGSP